MAYTSVEYQPQEIVFRQGEAGGYMCLVQNGAFEVVQELGGYEKPVAVLERGDFFGEMAVLDNQPRTHSVRARSTGKLIKIERQDFPGLLAKKPEIAVRMIRKLSNRLGDAEDMLVRAWAGASSDASAAASLAPDAEGGGEMTKNLPTMVTSKARLVHLADSSTLELPMQAEINIGRQDPINNVRPDLDLTTVDTQLTTSRRHAKIMRRNDGFYVLEERATNGTFVNGNRISAERPLEIRSGDDLMFGAVRMRFIID